MQPVPSKTNGNQNLYSLVLCGGSGTRLWPLSTQEKPKQFLKLGNSQESLLQLTLNRLKNLCPEERTWLITAQGQEDLLKKQTNKASSHILVEPVARNTAPAIAYACWKLLQRDKNSTVVIVSSDHAIQNTRSFEKSMEDAVQLAQLGYFVTIGIPPSFPATGFGYIERGLPLGTDGEIISPSQMSHKPDDALGFTVRSFREKPNSSVAEQFLRTGRYLWNAGIFVWQVSPFWKALSHLAPEITSFFENTPDDSAEFQEKYKDLPHIPIDIAFLEQTSHVACVPGHFDWNDVGSWAAVRECVPQDEAGNALAGEVIALESQGCVIHSSGPLVATVGLKDTVVVATEKSVLVIPRDRSQEVKKIIQQLSREGKTDLR